MSDRYCYTWPSGRVTIRYTATSLRHSPSDCLWVVPNTGDIPLEDARDRVAKVAEKHGEYLFAREVRAGAWDHRRDVQAALRGEKLKGE